MEKKSSMGVIIGWIAVSSNIIFLIIYHSKMIKGGDITYFWFYFSPLSLPFTYNNGFPFATVIPLINICLGIGIIFLRNIARLLFVIHQGINGFIAIGLMLFGLLWSFETPYWTRATLREILQSLSLFCSVVFIYVGYIIALTCPKVKEQFK